MNEILMNGTHRIYVLPVSQRIPYDILLLGDSADKQLCNTCQKTKYCKGKLYGGRKKSLFRKYIFSWNFSQQEGNKPTILFLCVRT